MSAILEVSHATRRFAGLIAVNALYFKDDWAVTFNKSQTQLAAFRDSAGGITDVPMMHATMTTAFRSDGRFAHDQPVMHVAEINDADCVA